VLSAVLFSFALSYIPLGAQVWGFLACQPVARPSMCLSYYTSIPSELPLVFLFSVLLFYLCVESLSLSAGVGLAST
jgi:hypothetical protein